ncbi:MAG: molybdopterin cofactor-binding domain-containing protein [Planctomycetota bacterium]|jgi:isoquinoline 1-oxidoreductase
MGMGPALREAIHFEDGKILNAGFADYRLPRFADMPKIDVHLVNNTDITRTVLDCYCETKSRTD